jgi:hypothetical protein
MLKFQQDNMMIEVAISDSALGTKRKVNFEGIRSMQFSIGFAQIVWIVSQLDDEGNKLNLPDINQDRVVISPISNQNQVDPNTGITLPEGEQGSPEFDWWWAVLQQQTLPTVLTQAISILYSQGRFDRP